MKTTQLNTKKTAQHGFTLVELLVGITLIGIVFVSSYSVLNTIIILNQRSRNLSLVTHAAEAKAEDLRSQGYAVLTNGTADFTNELSADISNPKTATVIISEPITGIKDVDILISYNDAGEDQNLRFKTQIGELGVGQY